MYTLRKRVRFYETDGMRVVYHGNYLNWFEEARVEYMREGGVCLNDLLAEGIVFPYRGNECEVYEIRCV